MKWLAIAVLILAQQPVKAPESKGASEANHTQSTASTQNSKSHQQASAQPAPVPTQTVVVIESKGNPETPSKGADANTRQTSDEDRATQGKLTWFTGILAVVGILQLIVMFLTWLIYKRQAREMRRQRHEMRQTRHIIWRQWKAMGVQAGHMEGQLTEMQESRKIANRTLILQYRPKIVVRYARALEFHFRLGEMGEGKIKLRMVNIGGSAATITSGFFALWSSISNEIDEIELLKGENMVLGEYTFEPGQSYTIECSLFTGTEHDVQWANFYKGLQGKQILGLRLVGEIRYVDQLGIPRATGVNRIYEPKIKWFSPSGEEGEYTD